MKKIIAILSVLLVAACVFAAVGDPDVAAKKDSIRVSTKIIPVEPTFVLRTIENGSESVTTGSDADHAGDGTTSGEIQYTQLVEGTTANTMPTNASGWKEDWISANYLLDNNATVKFGIYQREMAISDRTYTLKAETADLVFVSGSSKGTGAEKFKVTSTTPAITATAEDDLTDADKPNLDLSANANVLTAKYTGRVNNKTPLTSGHNDLEIGTFEVTWEANAKAEVGKYSADVTLTISAN